MRRSPSIVPDAADRDVYLVLADFGQLGRAFPETDEARSDRATVLQDLLQGQYRDPVRVVAFNTTEGWARDVSADVAHELAQLAAARDDSVPASIEDFLDRHLNPRHA